VLDSLKMSIPDKYSPELIDARTKEGWLNVKDGRGDIQTIDSFKNFVLQLNSKR